MKNYTTLFPEILGMSLDIEVYNSCPYKWFLKRCCHFYKNIYNVDLHAGKEFASAMEITRKAYFQQGLSAQEAIALGTKNLLEVYGASYAEAEYPDTNKTPEKMAEVFQALFIETPLDEMTTIPFEMADGSLSVEQTFTVELPYNHPDTGKPLVFQGTLDMLAMRDGLIYAEDEKTCQSVLLDHEKQSNLLRTQKEVAYVVLANKNKEKFGGGKVDFIKINRCKIKKNYTKGERKVEVYEFRVDEWYQQTWWNNLLYTVQAMLNKYLSYKVSLDMQDRCTNPEDAKKLQDEVIYQRSYGSACTLYFRPCEFTYHCTSGNGQNLVEQGYQQVVCNNLTKERALTIAQYRQEMLERIAEEK